MTPLPLPKMVPDDLVEDEPGEITGAVRVAALEGAQLAHEAEVASKRLQQRYKALRNRLSGSYSQVAADAGVRKSSP